MTGRPQPIRRKLMKMMLLTSTAAIVLMCTALLAYELLEERRDRQFEVETLARIIAANSTAALAFRDSEDAHELLATLSREPTIEATALYDASGAPFAAYSKPNAAALPARPEQDGYRLLGMHIEGFEPVSETRDQRLGTLFVRSDLSVVYQGLWIYGTIAAAVMAASILLAYMLSRILQQSVSRPVLSLAQSARAVSERADFTVRVPDAGDTDELNLLTDAFNQMLARIATQNATLNAQLARLNLLQRTTRAIGERQDLQSVFQVILRNLEDNMPIDFGCVCLYDPIKPSLTVNSIGSKSLSVARHMGLMPPASLPIDSNGLARCVAGQLVYEPDVREIDFLFPHLLAAEGLCSLVAAPLTVENRVFGALIAARREPAAFSSPDCEFLRQLSEHVALAAHQVQLNTELRQAYDDLRQSQHAILQQERLRALGQMASGIAHDINNAIAPVALYVDSLLERETALTDRARSSLQVIQRSIGDVGQTVSRLREFYRQRDHSPQFSSVDVNALIDDQLELTRARWSDMANERGVVIEVRRELADDLPRLLGNESDLRDALTNLIFNAVDAMPAGGLLTVRTSANRAGQVFVEIADSGAGMDETTRRRCFEPFFSTKGERGTGMGLAMVYGMIKRHGADIEMDSAPGAGTRVRMAFAAAPATDLVREIAATQRVAPQRVLVVDDDAVVAETLHDILKFDGHEVRVAEGGQAGIDAFRAGITAGTPYDIVITDLGMPYVDGRAVAAAIKTASPSTRVMMLTGWGQRLQKEQSIPADVDCLLSKPATLQELRRAMSEVVTAASLAGGVDSSGSPRHGDSDERH